MTGNQVLIAVAEELYKDEALQVGWGNSFEKNTVLRDNFVEDVHGMHSFRAFRAGSRYMREVTMSKSRILFAVGLGRVMYCYLLWFPERDRRYLGHMSVPRMHPFPKSD
jgi:hypothetical protein